MAAFLIETDQGDQGGAHYVVAFVYDGLLQVLFQTLDIEVVNDLSKNTQSVRFTHFVVILTDVFS